MPFNYYRLSNNQIYDCSEYDRYDRLVNSDPSPVKYENMFLFDIHLMGIIFRLLHTKETIRHLKKTYT